MWGFELDLSLLSATEREYVGSLPSVRPTVSWVWGEMDRVWDEMGLDNRKPLSEQRIHAFYQHPVWLVNGMFTATDPESVRHRKAIASLISNHEHSRVADYGGGFGQLARAVKACCKDAVVDIIEPFPTALALDRTRNDATIQFRETFVGQYDCVVAQDVLEHVEDPLGLVEHMVEATRPGGLLIFANCFYPFIKCHLPRTFYLRRTFSFVMGGFGLELLGPIVGAEHAVIFRRAGEVNKGKVARRSVLAKIVGTILNVSADIKHWLLR